MSPVDPPFRQRVWLKAIGIALGFVATVGVIIFRYVLSNRAAGPPVAFVGKVLEAGTNVPVSGAQIRCGSEVYRTDPAGQFSCTGHDVAFVSVEAPGFQFKMVATGHGGEEIIVPLRRLSSSERGTRGSVAGTAPTVPAIGKDEARLEALARVHKAQMAAESLLHATWKPNDAVFAGDRLRSVISELDKPTGETREPPATFGAVLKDATKTLTVSTGRELKRDADEVLQLTSSLPTSNDVPRAMRQSDTEDILNKVMRLLEDMERRLR